MGVDDGLALVVADRFLRRELRISTTYGNVPVETATRNALIFRELLGRTSVWPVLTGAACARDGFRQFATDIHGFDGMGGATQALDAALLHRVSGEITAALPNESRPAGDSVTLISIGPATNIPRLVSWYGRSAIQRIVIMAGSFFDLGNVTRSAEFNSYCDPMSLQATLDLQIPVTLVPLDLCRKVLLPREALIAMLDANRSPLAQLIASSHMHYMEVYRKTEGINGCFPHDSIAILAGVARERFYRVRGRVTVDCTSTARGQTTVELNEASHIEIAFGGELKWVRDTIFGLLSG
jgi:purine nucleosidase